MRSIHPPISGMKLNQKSSGMRQSTPHPTAFLESPPKWRKGARLKQSTSRRVNSGCGLCVGSDMLSKKQQPGLGGFDQSAHALGAQNLAYLLPIRIDCHSLQIGTEGAPCGLIRPGAVTTEGCCFTTMCTFSHVATSFPAQPARRSWRKPSPLGKKPFSDLSKIRL